MSSSQPPLNPARRKRTEPIVAGTKSNAGAGENMAIHNNAAAAAFIRATNGDASGPIGKYRWRICALLFCATAISYIDRQVFSILAPELQEEIGWSEIDYGYIVLAFQTAYAIGLVSVGSLIDRLGTQRGFSLSISLWSLASMGHAVARSAMGFGVARFALGLAEAGNFPAAVKTVAEWFPRKERALATGIFNAGSNVGAIAAPILVPIIAVRVGWPWTFILTGLLGFVWVAFWQKLYRPPEKHPRLSASELAYIQSDPVEPTGKIPWSRLLPHRQTWAFTLGKFITDPVWWFLLFWLPKFFNEAYGLDLSGLALPLVVIYVVADIGSIGGGWLSSMLLQQGYSLNRARKTAMLACALCVVPMIFAAQFRNLWVTVAIISLAAAAHQGWSANLYTLVSDMFPQRAVGSVVGIGGMAGSVGGMIAAAGIGHVLTLTGNNYAPLLTVCGFAYLLALGIIHCLAPRLEPATQNPPTGA
jgi:MFS transporter, ACS family, hexuronate transporter